MTIYRGINHGKIAYGTAHNYFNKLNVTVSDFADDCDCLITFPVQGFSFQLESGGPVEYSFDGYYVAGDMSDGYASDSLSFENRPASKIWFRLASGGTAALVRIEAWETR